jgi:hypothetical protein
METEKHLHVICHDIPWPADYGGVVDLFYKLKALHAEGVKIKLHCFLYGHRQEADELKRYCNEVHYYSRNSGLSAVEINKPYIVQSRANPELLANLLKDDYPVLMEGIHCTFFLKTLMERNRKVFLRLHNVESVYYNHLFKHEKKIFRKLYFLNESVFLRKYEKKLPDNLPVFTVSETDAEYYRESFGKTNVSFLPVFTPGNEIQCRQGIGKYCLYHGNLSISENEKAVMNLLKNVFSKIKIPLVIAGKNPSSRLQKEIAKNKNIRLVANPPETEMQELVSEAQVHVLPSMNNTGIKLKLVNALYNGRHCLVNDAAVAGTGLADACHIANTSNDIASVLIQLYHHPFSEEEIALRKKLLPRIFNNRENARKLIQSIW